MLSGLSAALAAAVVFGGAAIVQAIAARNVTRARTLSSNLVVQLLGQPTLYAAVVLNLVGFALHVVALRQLPLYLAQAAISASLVVTAVLAVTFFKDRLATAEWLAVGAVVVGLAALTIAAGEPGPTEMRVYLTGALAIAVVAIAVTAVFVSRIDGTTATMYLGALAGLAFAGVSIAARLIPDLNPANLLLTPVAYVLPLSGALGFGLFSLALQRGSVTNVTAPMVVLQTLAPASFGVALLGDGIREGAIALAVLGLVLTVAGAVVLGRFDAVRQM